MLKDTQIDRIVSSHRKRAQETAEAIRGSRPLTVEIAPMFDELQAPKWDGECLSDVAISDAHTAWQNDPHCSIDGVENLTTLQARMVRGLVEVMSQEAPGSVTAIVSHALALRTLICWVLGLQPTQNRSFHLSNASVTFLNVNEDAFARRQPRGISVEALNISPGRIESIAT